MQAKLIHEADGQRTFAVVLAPGESWIEGARARVLVRAGDQLTLV